MRRPLTTGEAAPLLGVSRETVRAWAAAGQIRAGLTERYQDAGEPPAAPR